MIVDKNYFQNLLERKSEDCESIGKLAARIQEGFLKTCPWFQTDKISHFESLFRFIAREKATNRSVERMNNGEIETWTDYRRKCLLMSGGCGTGKTTLAVFVAAELPGVEIFSADEIDFDYATLGNSEFCERYEKLTMAHGDTVIIDDFGSEQSRKRYGSAAFTLGLIERLYNQWCFSGSTCVLTTNLSFPQVREMYGERAASRIREMFDFVRFESLDFRAVRKGQTQKPEGESHE